MIICFTEFIVTKERIKKKARSRLKIATKIPMKKKKLFIDKSSTLHADFNDSFV